MSILLVLFSDGTITTPMHSVYKTFHDRDVEWKGDYPLFSIIGKVQTEYFKSKVLKSAPNLSNLSIEFSVKKHNENMSNQYFVDPWLVNTKETDRWFHIESTPVVLGNGCVAWFGDVVEITEQKQSYDVVNKNTTLLKTLLDHSPFYIWMKDCDGHFLEANQAFLSAIGISRLEDLIWKTEYDLWPKSLAEKYEEADKKVLLLGEPVLLEEVSLSNGTPHWIETYKSPIFNENKKIIGLAGFSKDITERRLREEELRLSSTVLQTVDEAVVILSNNGNILQVNPSFSMISGYTIDKVIGEHFTFLFTKQQREEWEKNFSKTFNSHGTWRGECRNMRSNGDHYIAQMSIKQIVGDFGQVLNQLIVFSDITQKKESDLRIHRMAHYDNLTELPNRALMMERLSAAILQAKREKAHCAVMFLDLNKFKPINDNLGHDVGDLVLQEVARRLTGIVRESDTVARIGGDEFIVILHEIKGTISIDIMAKKIISAIEKPMHLLNHDVGISTSVGVAVYPRHGLVAEELIKNADIAMYQSKSGGPGVYKIFLPD